MLNLRVRVVNDNGTVDATSRVLDTQGITYTAVENSSPTLKFNVSRGSFVPAAYPFVVRVEYAVDGGRYKELPEHSLFIVEKDSDDSKDVAQVATYEGEGFVPWLLRGSLLKWTTSTKQGKRTFLEAGGKASSAGHTLNIMMSEMKAGGWFPALNWSFAGAKDSAGQTWAADEKSVLEWEVTKTIAAVLEQFVKDGMCDWSTSGATLKVFRPGTAGIQRPDTVLGGADFTRVPVKMDSSGLYSHVRAAPDNLPWQNYEADSQIRRRFGHRSIFLSQSGVKDKASSRRHAQPYLDSGKKLQREESYEWEPGAGAVHPWRDFGLSDIVTARARGGKLQRRVIGIIVTVDSDGTAKVQARVGEVLKGRAAQDRDRLGSVAVGGAIGGTGSAFPASPGQAAIAPARPAALRAVTNTGVWREDGTAVSAVELAWEAVTADAEGGEIDISHYEVWSRTTSGMLARDVTVTDPATTIESWTPGLDRVIVVYAVSAEGVKSEPSLDLVLTPFYPLSIVPKPPTGFAVVSNTGKWTAAGPSAEVVLRFDAVTESTDGELVEISEYEVLDELGAVARVEGTPATVRLATGASATYRVRARSAFGIWGDVSDPVSVVGAAPALVARAPSLPSLTTGAGVVIARWDGRYSVADADGAFTVRVEQYTDMQWAYVGTALTGAGTVSIQTKPGDTVFVRLSAFDQMNRLTGTSAQVSIVAEGIELTDLDESLHQIIDGIDDFAEAIELASGKLTLSDRVPEPTDGTGKTAGSLWMVREVSAFTSLWEWDGAAWHKTDLSETIIPKLAIGEGTYGSLDGVRLTSKTIGAEKLLVGDFQNYWNDPEFKHPSKYSPWAVNGLGIERAGTGTQSGGYFPHTEISVQPGERFKFTVTKAHLEGATSSVALYVQRRSAEGAVAGNNTAVLHLNGADGDYSSEWVVPAGVERLTFGFYTQAATPSNVRVRLSNVRVFKMAAGELIVDGAVRARHVEMDEGFALKFWANEGNFGLIRADFLAPNVGDVLNIGANESITMIVDRQGEQDTLISDVRSTAESALTESEQAAIDAADAAQAAREADGKALVAQSQAQATSDRLTTQQSVFRVTATGAEVAARDGSNVVQITPDGIAIIQGGTAASTWDSGRFIVSEALVSRLQFANHVAEKSGTSRTIYRPI